MSFTLNLVTCICLLANYVYGAKLDKKAKRIAKNNVKAEIDVLAKSLNVEKDEFTIHDVFVYRKDIENLFDDVTPTFPVGFIVELPWNVQLTTIDSAFQSRSFGAFLTSDATLSQTDINKVSNHVRNIFNK